MNPFVQHLVRSGLSWGMKGMASGFLRDAAGARAVAGATLQEILRLNGSTQWGRDHGLNGAHPVEAFRSLPVTTYQDYAPYIERAANGEPGVLTSDPVTYFAVTSGTTGAQKLIPVTRRQSRVIMKNMLAPMGLAMRHGLLGPMRGPWLQIQTERVNGTTPGGIPRGAATSGGLRKMGAMADAMWSSPMGVLQVQDQATARYVHLLFALGQERLWTMVAIFASTLLFTLRDLHARAPELLRDLADGTLSPNLMLSQAERAELQAALRPDPQRAMRLSALLERGRFTVKDIWPEVGTIMTATGGSFRFYADQLAPYLGGVPLYSPVYAASEAAIGIGAPPDGSGYILTPGAACHEFLPLDGDGAPAGAPLGLHQLDPGAEYEILLTTYAGLTRYRLGDLVRLQRYEGQAPVLEFVQRRGQVLNVAGEKTNAVQVADAMDAACRETGATVLEYVVAIDPASTPARYLLLVEGVHGEAGGPLDAPRLSGAFDRHLQRTAPSYASHRRMGSLGPVALPLLHPGAFERYRDRRVAAGAAASQVKVPHVVPDPAFVQTHFAADIAQTIEVDLAP